MTQQISQALHDGEHADSTDAGEARLVGHAETRGARESFEMNGRPQTWREVGPFVWRDVRGDAQRF